MYLKLCNRIEPHPVTRLNHILFLIIGKHLCMAAQLSLKCHLVINIICDQHLE